MTTHRNLAAAAATSSRWGFNPDTISLTPLPLFHIGGIGWVYCGLWHGATTILVSEFNGAQVLDTLERRRVTNPIFVPTMVQILTAVPGAAERDYSALRSIVYGASPMTTTALRAALRTFGCEMIGLYGLTETTGGVVHSRRVRPRCGRTRSTCCGPPAGRTNGSSFGSWICLRARTFRPTASGRSGCGHRT